MLVCPENFANRPMAASLDVRKQLTVLRRQLARLHRIDDLLDAAAAGLTFDLAPTPTGRRAGRRPSWRDAVSQIEARYAPDCLATCEMCLLLPGRGARLHRGAGPRVREDLGGVENVRDGARPGPRATLPPSDQAEEAAPGCCAPPPGFAANASAEAV